MKVTQILGLAVFAAGVSAASWGQATLRPVTVAQAEQILEINRGHSDSSVAEELSGLELTERVSSARLAVWEKSARGPKVREELTLLADAAAFLPLPAADQLAKPAPALKDQGAMMGRVMEYARTTMQRLPNFLATRETAQIEDVPDAPNVGGQTYLNAVHVGSVDPDSATLHVVKRFSVAVAYRDGKEINDVAGRAKQVDVSQTGLTTSGEFGPILGLVISDAIRSSIHWGYWQQGAGGEEAMFRYAVPKLKSHYQVAFQYGGNLQQELPAYHGEIAIDPVTGSVLRLTVIADFPDNYRGVEASILVEFGPVQIGTQSYVCPVHAVALSRLPISPNVSEAQLPGARRRTEINDVTFVNYHRFGTASRLVSDEEAAAMSGQAPAVAATSAPADSAPVATPAPVRTAEAAVPVATAPIVPQAMQQPVPPPPAASPSVVVAAGPPVSFPPTPVLHARANLVLLDVVVVDKNKAPVQGLDQSRFRVLENGKERKISAFTEHSAKGAMRPVPVMLPPHTYSNVPTYPEGAAMNVLLIDGLNTPQLNLSDLRNQLIGYVSKLPPGTPLAIFTLSSRLRMVQGFTADTAQLLRALKEYQIGAHPDTKLANDSTVDQSSGVADLEAVGSLSPQMVAKILRMMQSLADEKTEAIDQRVRLTMDGLQELARYLAAVPGRKNLIWFSGSFPLALGPTDDIAMRAQGDPLRDMRNYEVEVRHTSDLLATARVAVYPVDARGVVETTAFAAGNSATPPLTPGPNGAMMSSNIVPTKEIAFAHTEMAEGDAMEEIAEETGGHAFLNNNDLGSSVASVVNNTANYYTIGYVPQGKLDGGFRNLKVTVDGAKYTLSYRKGYFADDPDHVTDSSALVTRAHSPLIAATLAGGPPSTQILFQARVLPASDPQFAGKGLETMPAGEMSAAAKGPMQRTVADFTVDAATVTFTPEADGKQGAKLEFAVVAYDAEQVRVNYVDRSLQMDYTTDQYADIVKNGLRVRMVIDVPKTAVSLRMAVFDPEDVKTGSVEVPVKQ